MVQRREDATLGNAGITGEEQTHGSQLRTGLSDDGYILERMGLCARGEVRLHALRVCRSLLPIVTNADI